MISIPILDDNYQPTTDFVFGRPLVRVKAWINGDLVLADGLGLIDTGSRSSFIGQNRLGNNIPDNYIPTHHGGGDGVTGVFQYGRLQIENFRPIDLQLTVFEGRHFDVIIGRDVLRFCHLVMDHSAQIYTLDMR
jgi:hypothetical protein